jgi:hypothetical protein
MNEIYSLVVIASGCQCQSRNVLSAIPASSDTLESKGAAYEAVLNKVRTKNNPLFL